MKKSKAPQSKTTEILISDEIETPYPYCILPYNKYEKSLTELVEKDQLNPRPRTLLSVTTWDGRPLFNLRSLE